MSDSDRKILREHRARVMNKVMDEKNLDALLLMSLDNVRYATDFFRPFYSLEEYMEHFGALLVRGRDGATFFTIPPDPYFQQVNPWIPDVRYLRSYMPTCDYASWADDLRKPIEEYGLSKKRIGVDYMSFHAMNYLKKKLPETTFEPAYDELLRARIVKHPIEVKFIKEAVKIADLAIKGAWEIAEPGVTEYQLVGAAAKAMYDAGAEALTHTPAIRAGEGSLVLQFYPTQRKLHYGDIVNADLGCIYEGYCSDILRTTVVGKPTKVQGDIYQALCDAHLKVIENMRVGVSIRELFETWEKSIGQYAKYSIPWAHGIGMKLAEPPYMMQEGEAAQVRLQAGMVLAWEPHVGVSGLAERIGGHLIVEDDVAITEKGPERLSLFPYDEKLLGRS